VCVLAAPRADGWMQDVAREMNLSETAFLLRGSGPGEFHLRWFTPTVEVDLCGHATLASAHVLWEDGHLPPGAEARFLTRSGPLTALRRDRWIEMDFPAEPAEAADAPEWLADALGVEPVWVGRNRFDLLVELPSEAAVRAVRPEPGRLRRIPARGIIVTSRPRSGEHHFVSRFFAPAVGVDEDPVTGSAHCCLGPFWAERLGLEEVVGFQASARGGVVRVRVQGERVLLSGQAVTVMRGELV
jgi:PhzF family phenazine biosynthesis protein